MSKGTTLTTHQTSLPNLVTDKAHHQLGWAPRWDVATTVGWYRQVQQRVGSTLQWCQADLALDQRDPNP